jgi:hypothetical protein
VTQAEYREYDEHLQMCLADSYVIPFSVSKKMFGSLLLAARLKKWQRMSELVAGERDLSLQDEEVGECRRLAIDQILGMLKDGETARCTQADPTGERNLHLANQLRVSLGRREDLSPRDAEEIVRRSRPAFRAGIHGRLVLPEMPVSEAA